MHQTPRNGQWIADALERFEGPLCRYARAVLGDAERARDVVQDTFLRLVQTPPEISPGDDVQAANGRLKAWLFTVCHRRALDVRRKERRMTTTPTDAFDLRTTPDASPSACVEAAEDHARILAALDTLPDHQRQCLRLKFAAGLTYAQIADATGLSASNVGYLIHHGLKTLRTQLHDDAPGRPDHKP